MNDDDELDHQSIETDDAEIEQSSNLVSSPDVTVSLYIYFTKLQLSFLLAAFKLLVDYNSGLKRYEVTPSRKRAVIALSKRNYRTAARKITKDSSTSSYTLAALVHKVRGEMTELCSLQHNSLLRDLHEAVKRFSWETLWREFEMKLPTLFNLLRGILPKADKKFISFVISLLVKKRCKHMSLVQRVISVLLYGNAVKKQVCNIMYVDVVLFIFKVTICNQDMIARTAVCDLSFA